MNREPDSRWENAETGDWLQQGIAAAKVGEHARARDLLLRVVEVDEGNVKAWLWLSGVVDTLEDKEICLENVLALVPDHSAARKGLEWVRRQKGLQPMPATPEAPGADTAVSSPPPAPQPVRAAAGINYEDELLCPYCLAHTEADDRACAACKGKLWIKQRRRPKPSFWWWMALMMQGLAVAVYLFGPMMLILYAASEAGISDLVGLVMAYAGVPTGLDPLQVDVAMGIVPPAYLFGTIIMLFYALVVFVGVYARWKPIWYLFLINAVWALVTAVAVMALVPAAGLIPGVVGVAVALLLILVVFQMEDDFSTDRRRIVLRLDPGAREGYDFLVRGQHYGRQGMLGLAALHLQRAGGLLPDRLDAQLSLAATYMNLRRYDLADAVLRQAARIDADHADVVHLSGVLEQLVSQGSAA